MRGSRLQPILLSSAVLAALPGLGAASTVKLSLKPELPKAHTKAEQATEVDSGLQLAVHNPLLKVALNYKLKARFDEEGNSARNSTSQRVGAQLHSTIVDDLLSGKTQLKAVSTFESGTQQYSHQFNPSHSRPLLNLATLDLNYNYGMKRAAAASRGDQSHAYTVGLKGSLPGGVNWSGGYSTSNTLFGQTSKETQIESIKLRSDYRISPAMKVELFSDVKEKTQFSAADKARIAEFRYGAGVSWQPSARYAFDLKVDRKTLATTGDATILGSGALSWFPEQGMAISLEYGDQLVEGTRGFLFSTKLDLDRFQAR